jgi:hypothetical protein
MKEHCRTFQDWLCIFPFASRAWAASVLMLAFAQPSTASERHVVETYRKEIKPLLGKYCFDCHADGVKKGNVSFDAFKSDEELTGKRELWHAVL